MSCTFYTFLCSENQSRLLKWLVEGNPAVMPEPCKSCLAGMSSKPRAADTQQRPNT